MIKKKKSEKSEWYIYSSIAITGALTFFAIHITKEGSSTQTFGAAMATLVGVGFCSSEKWKKKKEIIHKWVVAIAFCFVILFVIIKQPKQIKW